VGWAGCPDQAAAGSPVGAAGVAADGVMVGVGTAWGAVGVAVVGGAGASSGVSCKTALVVASEATGAMVRQEQSSRQARPIPIHGHWMAA
jgi:hypothetical protein